MDEAAYFIGQILGFLFIFVWVPLSGFRVGRALMDALLLPTHTPAPKRKPKKQPPRAKKAPSKHSYPTESSFEEKYKITNPIEFDT